MEERLKQSIRSVPDFPKPGILFRDITPVLSDPALFRDTIEELAAPFRNDRIAKVLGIESRGFIFGPPLAIQLGAGFVPARKRGKLPRETIRETYALEYGTDSLEIHRDAFAPGERVLIVDDLLATGGTASGAARLAEKVGAEVVGAAFVVELKFLDGRAKLPGRRVHVLVRY
ncbi:MAG TPA: adenine phosphoribosyltransferase [Candidatus Polarisedimenticolia bacterium]|jgi:adenine phosphoribosyltransferase|nr:adenine phosphoribosyltransferase [Candidatus Polarisedimenticolia bacterium]